jgi:hypothetical protein
MNKCGHGTNRLYGGASVHQIRHRRDGNFCLCEHVLQAPIVPFHAYSSCCLLYLLFGLTTIKKQIMVSPTQTRTSGGKTYSVKIYIHFQAQEWSFGFGVMLPYEWYFVKINWCHARSRVVSIEVLQCQT